MENNKNGVASLHTDEDYKNVEGLKCCFEALSQDIRGRQFNLNFRYKFRILPCNAVIHPLLLFLPHYVP